MNSQETVKQCCARLYESDLAKMLLGDSFHPGGLKLTERLGTLLGLTTQSRVLDIASGKGTSALFLAERFGCEVLGIDYSGQNVEQAPSAPAARGMDSRVSFQSGHADRFPVLESSFYSSTWEGAFCMPPANPAA